MKTKFFSSLFFLLLFTQSYAWYDTGNRMLQNCKGPSVEQVYCIGFVTGAADLREVWLVTHGTSENLGCHIPQEVSKRQLADILIQYLENNPAERHKPASGLFIDSMSRAFPAPCKK
jgi:hypothetical protein